MLDNFEMAGQIRVIDSYVFCNKTYLGTDIYFPQSRLNSIIFPHRPHTHRIDVFE